MDFDIYFGDLDSEAQEALLKAVGIEDYKDLSWDIIPVATIHLNRREDEANG